MQMRVFGKHSVVWIWKGYANYPPYEFSDYRHAEGKLKEALSTGWADEHEVVFGKRTCGCCGFIHNSLGKWTGRRMRVINGQVVDGMEKK